MSKHNNKRAQEVNQVRIQFTNKPITAWGGIASVISKFLDQIKFKEWVKEQMPIKEGSNNSKGIYPKVLCQFLTI